MTRPPKIEDFRDTRPAQDFRDQDFRDYNENKKACPAFFRGLADSPVPRIGQLEKQGFVTRTRFW